MKINSKNESRRNQNCIYLLEIIESNLEIRNVFRCNNKIILSNEMKSLKWIELYPIKEIIMHLRKKYHSLSDNKRSDAN
jgi:hypothetical protein